MFLNYFYTLGISIIAFVKSYRTSVKFLLFCLFQLFSTSTYNILVFREVITGIFYIGVRPAVFYNIFGLIGGFFLLSNFFNFFSGLDLEILGSQFIIWTILDELFPILCAFMLIFRSSTYNITRFTLMQVTGEFRAIEAYKIDVIEFFVLPLALSYAFSLFFLTLGFNTAALLGGYLHLLFVNGFGYEAFVFNISNYIENWDLFLMLGKPFCMGFILGVVSAYSSMTTKGQLNQVPYLVSRFVMNAAIYIVFIDVIFAGLRWI